MKIHPRAVFNAIALPIVALATCLAVCWMVLTYRDMMELEEELRLSKVPRSMLLAKFGGKISNVEFIKNPEHYANRYHEVDEVNLMLMIGSARDNGDSISEVATYMGDIEFYHGENMGVVSVYFDGGRALLGYRGKVYTPVKE